jgi:hypothetical protein
MKVYFDHEKLDVYREAIAFCAWAGELLNTISVKAAAKDQLDRASTSIPLNLAEGNGKFSGKIVRAFSKLPVGRHLNAQHALMFWWREGWLLRSRSTALRKISRGSFRCSWECCDGFQIVRISCGKRGANTNSSTSGSTRTKGKRHEQTHPS